MYVNVCESYESYLENVLETEAILMSRPATTDLSALLSGTAVKVIEVE